MRALLLIVALLWAVPLRAQEAPKPRRSTTERVDRLPGVDLARGISELTGVAISPLLGVSTVGAWRYAWASPDERTRLPWFCHPAFWGLGFGVLGACFLKDTFGAASPPLLKKPLDVLELFENKLSAVVACSAFLPFVVSQFTPHAAAPAEAYLGSLGTPFAAITAALPLDARLITIPLAMIGFAAVWMASHAINVLIALSPFGLIDAGLKLFRTAILGAITASAFLSPVLGALLALIIVAVALWVAPWAFRLAVFGTVFGLDVLLPSRGRKRLRLHEPHAFLARRIEAAPTRSYGRLVRRENGAAGFAYRPWLILPERIVPLSLEKTCLGKGIFFPSIHLPCPRRGSMGVAVMLLPRYRGHEDVLARQFGITQIQESFLQRGISAIRGWFREVVRGKAAAAE